MAQWLFCVFAGVTPVQQFCSTNDVAKSFGSISSQRRPPIAHARSLVLTELCKFCIRVSMVRTSLSLNVGTLNVSYICLQLGLLAEHQCDCELSFSTPTFTKSTVTVEGDRAVFLRLCRLSPRQSGVSHRTTKDFAKNASWALGWVSLADLLVS